MSTTSLTLPVILGCSPMLQRQRKSYKLCRITSSVDDDVMSISATRRVSWSRCSNPTKKRWVFMAFFMGMKALFSWQNQMRFHPSVPDPSNHVCAGKIPDRGPQDTGERADTFSQVYALLYELVTKVNQFICSYR